MPRFEFNGQVYELDSQNFLLNYSEWDENFATGIAREFGIPNLTKEHWDVVKAIKKEYETTRKCPISYETCRNCGLRLKDLKRLFPTGYLRGACRISGITYKEAYLAQCQLPITAEDLNIISASKTYTIDVRGFLVNADEWDEYYAIFRALDMKIPGGRLSDVHWQIINFLREYYEKTGKVPTIYETCEKNGLELDELEQIFPDGYHRGAVKIAGLRVR